MQQKPYLWQNSVCSGHNIYGKYRKYIILLEYLLDTESTDSTKSTESTESTESKESTEYFWNTCWIHFYTFWIRLGHFFGHLSDTFLDTFYRITESIENTENTKSTESTESTESIDSTKSTETRESTEITESTEYFWNTCWIHFEYFLDTIGIVFFVFFTFWILFGYVWDNLCILS